ncbi:MAG: DNA polymerase ligase N-terminal domain-containing protein [Xanthomonadales bacterium]|nr:DNA polymerase ligase N-terminal domain-containing protein [Xanthomonadales bacterium]
MGTGEYKKKRDFRKTPEPRGGSSGRSGKPLFVIQKHDASSLHYDFRIEVDGALKSWAVPKGPSTDPSEKRLALPTEDHPLKYAEFEGVIPAGEYGGGTVLVWDKGPYENLTEKDGERVPIAAALKNGHAVIALHGQKIKGGYALHKTGDERWLLVKMNDDEADARRNPVSTEPESVISGRTIEEIADEEAADPPG